MQLYPAVVIGGPPQCGQSALADSLSEALKARGVEHGVLRVEKIAGPGGQAASAADVCRAIAQRKTPLIVAPSALPVPIPETGTGSGTVAGQAGGWDAERQAEVFACCTGTILLTPDEGARNTWRALAARRGLALLADLRSVPRAEPPPDHPSASPPVEGMGGGSGQAGQAPSGEDWVEATGPIVRGQISGLEPGRPAEGPAFEALADLLAMLFA